MDIKFWLPTAISLVAIFWAYIQNRKIEEIKNTHAKNILVSKLQFEKEFEVYKDIWSKLIELRGSLLAFSPEMYQIHESDEELRKKSIQKLGRIYIELTESYEKNRPFYSNEIYTLIKEYLTTAHKTLQWSVLNKQSAVLENWEELYKNKATILDSTDMISDAIRSRIGSMHVQ